MLRRPSRGAVAALLSGVAAITAGCDGDEAADRPLPPADAPNVVVVMTDDQGTDTMRAMPQTRRLIGGEGVTFTNAVASYPLCCPSRATFLTGQYTHNHGVLDNDPPLGGYARLRGHHTLAQWLHDAGYNTAHVGKYLNGYGQDGTEREIPPGWGRWWALVPEAKVHAYDYPLNENGELVSYGSRPADYKTDVLAGLAADYVRRAARGERPFFLSVATTAPHTDKSIPVGQRNPEPAPRDLGSFEGTELPRNPSFREQDVSDKPRFVQQRRVPGRQAERELQINYVSQLEALGAVDDLVRGLVEELRNAGELERTLIVFTSDNGYLRGQHRVLSGKGVLYEESIRVPLLARGPGLPHGERSDQPVANIDLAPTILGLTGAEADVDLDGLSLIDLVRHPEPGRAILLEILGERNKPKVLGVRTPRYVYTEYEGAERELYDLRRDPFQLESVHDDPRYAETAAELAARLDELRDCAGDSCR